MILIMAQVKFPNGIVARSGNRADKLYGSATFNDASIFVCFPPSFRAQNGGFAGFAGDKGCISGNCQVGAIWLADENCQASVNCKVRVDPE